MSASSGWEKVMVQVTCVAIAAVSFGTTVLVYANELGKVAGKLLSVAFILSA